MMVLLRAIESCRVLDFQIGPFPLLALGDEKFLRDRPLLRVVHKKSVAILIRVRHIGHICLLEERFENLIVADHGRIKLDAQSFRMIFD